MEDTFKRFLVGYVSAGHTLDDSAQEELEDLADKFVKSVYPQYIFTSNATDLFVHDLRQEMSIDNQSFFKLSFNESRYVKHLEDWIRYLSESNSKERE